MVTENDTAHMVVDRSSDSEAQETTDLREFAIELFGEQHVSSLCVSASNGFVSFLIAPDGSSDGWETSREFDRLRRRFIASARYRAVEIEYGEVDENRVTSSPNRAKLLVALDRIQELGVEDEHIVAIREALGLHIAHIMEPPR